MTDTPSNKIRPEHNPWYLLATLHGEAVSSGDDRHASNRTAWNRLMAAELAEDARDLLIKEGRCSAEDLVPFTAEELDNIEKLFAERHQQVTVGAGTTEAKMPLPNLKRDPINFSNIEFDRPFVVEGFLFPNKTFFSESANFWCTTFNRAVQFSLRQRV